MNSATANTSSDSVYYYSPLLVLEALLGPEEGTGLLRGLFEDLKRSGFDLQARLLFRLALLRLFAFVFGEQVSEGSVGQDRGRGDDGRRDQLRGRDAAVICCCCCCCY